MSKIVRHDVNEKWAHSGIIEAGDFAFIGYCAGGIGQSTEAQINCAFDQLESRLKLIGLTLESVVQMDCMFGDIAEIPIMEKIIKARFNGKYPVRKSFERDRIGDIKFQVDAIAYKGSLS